MGPGLLGYLEFHLPGLQIPVVLWPFWRLAASSTLGLTVGARTRGMTRKLHPCARTNAKLRREIQESAETNKALAARLGLNLKTVAKWRSRTTTSDARKGPKRPASTELSATEEALIVVFRKHTRLPLNACLAHLKPRIPALSRSALHRCLKRYGVSRIPKDLAKRPTEFELGAEPSDYAIEFCAMPGEAGGYLYTAISRIAISQTRFVFAKVMKGVSGYDAADFLDDLCENAPGKISSVKTTDHEAFTHPKGRPWEPKYPDRMHPFRKACLASRIRPIVMESKSSARMMVLKEWRDVLPKVRRKAGEPRRSAIGLRTDFDAQTVRSVAERLMDRPQARRLLAVAATFDGAKS